jgi:transcriptional regulator with XRE-family HTH domain
MKQQLKKLRRAAGITQYALAAATGISRARISHFELGISKPTEQEHSLIKKVLSDRLRGNAAIIDDLGDEETSRGTRLRSATA